jgi:hypothetical protein
LERDIHRYHIRQKVNDLSEKRMEKESLGDRTSPQESPALGDGGKKSQVFANPQL